MRRIIRVILLLIVYILGKSKHLIPPHRVVFYTVFYTVFYLASPRQVDVSVAVTRPAAAPHQVGAPEVVVRAAVAAGAWGRERFLCCRFLWLYRFLSYSSMIWTKNHDWYKIARSGCPSSGRSGALGGVISCCRSLWLFYHVIVFYHVKVFCNYIVFYDVIFFYD